MEINLTSTGNAHLVEIAGRIDALNNLKTEEFFNQITENQNLDIIVDCQKLDFINSSGLRVLIMSLKKARKAGKQLILCNLQKNIKEVFVYSGFDKLFDINLDNEQALALIK
jgi:anti-sigma B factor antagonist